MNLAVTIRDDGQVNPLTVIDVSQGVTRLFRIETGERRYWATWLLREFFSGYTHDGKIPCIVVPADKASAFRQAKENTAVLDSCPLTHIHNRQRVDLSIIPNGDSQIDQIA